jgi:two-component system, OmpR family, response regulator MprA
MVGMTRTVLVVDDDRAIRDSLERALQLEGYDVELAADGVAAVIAARRPELSAIVLDVGLPGIDGLGVCQVLRAEQIRTPILMLTARVETTARVAGLDAGADDYLAKPFELDELLARLRALVRRSRMTAADPSTDPTTALAAGELRIAPDERRAWWAGTEIALSKTEFDLLELLLRHRGQVLPHAVVYERIWGYDFGPDSNNLAVYISYLRRKLADAGAPDVIRTVRGVGYSLDLR